MNRVSLTEIIKNRRPEGAPVLVCTPGMGSSLEVKVLCRRRWC